MRRKQYTITSRAVHDHAARLCQEHLRLRDHGPKCTAPTLLALLLYAAARMTSLAAACGSLSEAASGRSADRSEPTAVPGDALLDSAGGGGGPGAL